MNLSFVGTGNTATVLARLCKEKGHFIRQVIGRNIASAQKLASEVDAAYADIKDEPDKDVDLVIIAISDNSLTYALSGLHFGKVPVVHTAGSVSIDVLKCVTENYGVIYPVQTMSKEIKDIPPVPFSIEGSNDAMLDFVRKFTDSIGSRTEVMDGEKRLRLHTAAVIVNNFSNHLYAVAETFCANEHVDFNLLRPLILETAVRVQDHSPAEVQTGPGMRKDIATIDKHLRLLNAYPKLRIMYLRLTDGIMNP